MTESSVAPASTPPVPLCPWCSPHRNRSASLRHPPGTRRCQHWPGFREAETPVAPESCVALWTAVGNDAVLHCDIVWFLGAHNRPGSFLWVCEALGMDPDRTRRRALARIHRNLQQRLGPA